MKYVGVLLAATVMAVVLPLTSAIAADSSQPESGEVKLTFDASDAMAKFMTPLKMTGGKTFTVTGKDGTIAVGSSSVSVGATWGGNSAMLGVDRDGNGKIDKGEWAAPSREHTATFRLKLGEGAGAQEVVLLFTNIAVSIKNNAAVAFSGNYYIACGRRGAVNGVPVTILDDNLDGQFSTDGSDAIVIGGGSTVGLPLRKVHQIGNALYELEVASDGTTLKFNKKTDAKLGVVEVPIKTPPLKCLVVTGDNGSFDLAAAGSAAGIPAGDYKLSYGMLGQGKDTLLMVPARSPLTYSITADMINTIRIGAPLTVDFPGSYKDGKVIVDPGVQIFGSGGEKYVTDFVTSPTGRPKIILSNGSKQISCESMGVG